MTDGPVLLPPPGNHGAAAASLASSAAAVRARWPRRPLAGLILGTGLGAVGRIVRREAEIPYRELPWLPPATAPGHAGRLLAGECAGRPVIVLEGRSHLYEGRTVEETTRGVRLLAALGARTLLITNAAGGLNPGFRTGDLMAAAGQLNLLFRHIAPADLGLSAGERGDPSRWRLPAPYDDGLRERAAAAARRCRAPLHVGVYAAVTGPNYETRAEYRLLRRLGADVVGMSSVPEALAAAALGLRVLAVSVVTNVAAPDAPARVESDDVVLAAQTAVPRLATICADVIAGLE